MNWEALGAVGEIIGAIAILVTLYYLAKQIKIQHRELERSNNHVRAQLAIEINRTFVENFDPLMRDKDFVPIVHKGINDQPLDEIERTQFAQYVNRWVALLESLITVERSDVLFSDDYDFDFLFGNSYASRLLDTKVGSLWFEQEAPLLYSEEYLNSIREYRAKRGKHTND